MIIAIDGPAGVGKSTVAHRIAEQFGFQFLNSGNFYRCVAFYALKNKISPEDSAALIETAEHLPLTLQNGVFYIDGENIEPYLHTHEIDEIVAPISAVPGVRAAVNALIRRLYRNTDLVCEGRDMTTVVFPEAEVKIFLDASPEVRADRRFRQHGENDYGTVLSAIKKRDHVDMNKPIGNLKIADDALYIDTSEMDPEAVLKKIFNYINAKAGERNEF